MTELEDLLRQSETHRQDLEEQLRVKEQQFTAALSAATKVWCITYNIFEFLLSSLYCLDIEITSLRF